jgi:hypothetical protein
MEFIKLPFIIQVSQIIFPMHLKLNIMQKVGVKKLFSETNLIIFTLLHKNMSS